MKQRHFSKEVFNQTENMTGLSSEAMLTLYSNVKEAMETKFAARGNSLRKGFDYEIPENLRAFFNDVRRSGRELKAGYPDSESKLASETFMNFYLIAIAENILLHSSREEQPAEARTQEQFIDQSLYFSLLIQKEAGNKCPESQEDQIAYSENVMSAYWKCFRDVQRCVAGKIAGGVEDARNIQSGCVGEMVAAQLAHGNGLNVYLDLGLEAPEGIEMDSRHRIDQVWIDKRNGRGYGVQIKRVSDVKGMRVINAYDSECVDILQREGIDFSADERALKRGCAGLGSRFNMPITPLVIVIPGNDSELYYPNTGIPTEKGQLFFEEQLQDANRINSRIEN